MGRGGSVEVVCIRGAHWVEIEDGHWGVYWGGGGGSGEVVHTVRVHIEGAHLGAYWKCILGCISG